MKTLCCKNQENPSDRISHAWAPLREAKKRGKLYSVLYIHVLATGIVQKFLILQFFLKTVLRIPSVSIWKPDPAPAC
jgi:hypothetical protein